MFHVSGKLNKHNVRIWGSEHPHEIRELERDNPKVNVWCELMCNRVIGPFSSTREQLLQTFTWNFLTEYVAPKLIDSQPTIIFQQDGAPLHWGLRVCQFLNETFSD